MLLLVFLLAFRSNGFIIEKEMPDYKQESPVIGLHEAHMDGPEIANQALTPGKKTPSDIYSPELAIHQFDWAAECILFNGEDAQHHDWRYTFIKAECTSHPDGHLRAVKITCEARYRAIPGNHIWQVADLTLTRLCPVGTRCMSTTFIATGDGGPDEKLVCVDEQNIVEETVNAKDKEASSSHQDIHCGLELRLPGDHYRAKPGQQPIEVILTEQVLNIDGSPYEAPVLYIRDKSNPYKVYDRTFRQHASVASTIVEIGVYRGNFVQKAYQFCMIMAPSYVAKSVMFAYAFLEVEHLRHGRLQLQLNQDQSG